MIAASPDTFTYLKCGCPTSDCVNSVGKNEYSGSRSSGSRSKSLTRRQKNYGDTKKKGGSEEPPFGTSAEAGYFPAGFTLDLSRIDPNPSRPMTSATPLKMIPPVFVTPT